MRKILTTQSTVTCGHQDPPAKSGMVQVASTAKLKVNGNPVLLEASVVGKPIPDCGTKPNTNQGDLPCLTVTSVANTPPPKLTVDGAPVLVDTITGSTTGTVLSAPQSALTATANQSKLVTT